MSKDLPAAVLREMEEVAAIEAEITPPTPPVEPPAPEPPTAPVDTAPPAVDWEQRFKTLQGKYNSEVPSLTKQVKDLTTEVEQLRSKPATPAPATPTAGLVTDKDTDEFGADLIGLMRRAATEVFGPERDRLEAEIAALKGLIPDLKTDVEKVTVSQDTANRDTYFAKLAEDVPTYAVINDEEAFKAWLEQADPMSGVNRNALLQDAFGKFDVPRTATIFKSYLTETGRAAPKAIDPPAAPAEPAATGLEQEISPGNSRTSNTPVATEGKIWSEAEMGEFYSAVTRGDYRGNPAEAQRIDAEIDKALAEGRVKG